MSEQKFLATGNPRKFFEKPEWVEGLGWREESHVSPGKGYTEILGGGWRRWSEPIPVREHQKTS